MEEKSSGWNVVDRIVVSQLPNYFIECNNNFKQMAHLTKKLTSLA